ncbi:uncharacterized protein LOC144705736 isoform X2 [Wolffia australiana]
MKDRKTGKPRGFGFITFADPSVVDRVIEDEHVFSGKQVEIKRTIPREAGPGSRDFKTRKIFVGGIPTSVTEDEFREFFEKFGEVKEHQIMRDHSNNRSRGFGFITFDSEKSVDDLLAKGNRVDFAGTQVEVKKAEPKKPIVSPPRHFRNPPSSFGGGRYDDPYGEYEREMFRPRYDRIGGPLPGRAGMYERYGGGDLGPAYKGYGGGGSGGVGPYPGESALGFSGYYGRGYDPGNYRASESYRGYGIGADPAVFGGGGEDYRGYNGPDVAGYEGGGQFGLGPGYGGYGVAGAGGSGSGSGGLYGSRGGYSGPAGARYHPYGR